MKKIFCDNCGKEIIKKNQVYHISFSVEDIVTCRKEICENCYFNIRGINVFEKILPPRPYSDF